METPIAWQFLLGFAFGVIFVLATIFVTTILNTLRADTKRRL